MRGIILSGSRLVPPLALASGGLSAWLDALEVDICGPYNFILWSR